MEHEATKKAKSTMDPNEFGRWNAVLGAPQREFIGLSLC
jgi:hypothetical protein